MKLYKKNRNINDDMFLIYILLIYVFWSIRDFGISQILYEAIFGIVGILYIIIRKRKLILTRINKYILYLTFIVTFFFFLPNSSSNIRSTATLVINLMMCSVFVLASSQTEITFFRFEKIIIWSTLIYSIYSNICVIFPSVYIRFINVFLKSISLKSALQYIRGGYGPIIAESANYLPFIFTTGILVVYSNIIFNVNRNRKRYIILFILFISSLLLYGRRGEFISLVFALLITHFIVKHKRKISLNKNIFLVPIIIVILISVYKYLTNLGYLGRISGFIDTIFTINDMSIDEVNNLSTNRIDLWKLALSHFIKNPIFGIGWSQFKNLHGINVHNTYLQLLCEIGIVGFVLFMFPIVSLYKRTLLLLIKAKRNQTINDVYKRALIISFGLQTFLLIINFIDPAFYRTFSIFVLAICILLLELVNNRIISNK